MEAGGDGGGKVPVTAGQYRELASYVADALCDGGCAAEYFILEWQEEPVLFSFRACVCCRETPCLLFAALRPVFGGRAYDFSAKRLASYL